jgi:hypothetical protein
MDENQNLKAYVPNRTEISTDLVRIDRSPALTMKAALLVKTLTPNPIPPNLSAALTIFIFELTQLSREGTGTAAASEEGATVDARQGKQNGIGDLIISEISSSWSPNKALILASTSTIQRACGSMPRGKGGVLGGGGSAAMELSKGSPRGGATKRGQQH